MTVVNPPIVDVSLAQMIEAIETQNGHQPDDAVFRYFQCSDINARGEPSCTVTLRLTFGELRKVLL